MCIIASGTVDDAAPDGVVTVDDRDGDGVVDVDDNCPDRKNTDQANEDGDKFGDACDPCPPDRNDSPSDPDGDGVADACDPNPTVPGDKLELFEGFHAGVPAWARSQNWAAAPGGEAIRVTATINADEFVVIPVSDPDRVNVSASVVIEALVGANIDHEIGVVVPYEPSSYNGISCDLVEDGDRFLGMWDDFGDRELDTTAFIWGTAIEYRFTMVRRATSYTCNVFEPSTTKHTAMGTSNAAPGSSPTMAIRAYAMTARVAWVMVVRSP